MPSPSHDWRFTHDLGAFLDRAGHFLRSEPALHTVPLTVTDALRRRGTRAYGEEAPYFAWLTDTEGAVCATALRTPPHRLHLTATTLEAADALAGRLAKTGGMLPGVGGPAETAAEFAAAWERRTGAAARLAVRHRLYRLGTITVPEPAPPGRARVATGEDHGLVARWHGEFRAGVGEHAREDPDRWAGARIAYGGITLWELPDGTPVAMAGATPEVAGQVRVAPVYTPAPLRGRGYAGAVTAEVSRAARATGADEVLLFADLANPTSNGLYQRIGYRPVRDFASYLFTAT
ncbi:GNAT family N-acetyltransferase [Streptomyces sporangiiformans]|uniref:GNAT family N-acetyltransferase n=1 Tax=Streptomyces sporangiiformans TaxID=2315329 RepID=A0A505DK33_9ACTN|nr:GNAT family N-acetyltransferase [Streptomyces sporangiiformans]TPQ19129.1 GNAT family N-acetyltransferase [Streptomyces sporangiiformans]